MNFEEACSLIKELLNRSNGAPIELPSGNQLEFCLTRKCTADEISTFEEVHQINLPKEYKYFMMQVGASKIYMDQFGLGIEFFPLEFLAEYASEIFIGMKNMYPSFFPVAANLGRGDVIAFDLRLGADCPNLGVFSPEENPETWLDDNVTRFFFSDWLIKLVESEGE